MHTSPKSFPSAVLLAGVLCLSCILPAAAADVLPGQRVLRQNEFNLYGPRPFPEQISYVVDDMVDQILKRQREDGSWLDHTYKLDGSMHVNHLAGGTVKIITNTSLMCLVLRQHEDADRAAIDEAITKGARYVVGCVNQGRLTENVGDTGWRMGYALRFLAREYPHVEDAQLQSAMRGAAEVLVKGLWNTRMGTRADKATVATMNKPGDLGIRLDRESTSECLVADCPEDSAAYQGGLRAGDVLVSVNGIQLGSPLNYDFMRFDWMAGDALTCGVRRGSEKKVLKLTPQAVYPGVLGVQVADSPDGLVVESLDFLTGADRAGIRKGDRILNIDGTPVRSAADVNALKLMAGQTIEVEGERKGEPFKSRWQCAPVPFAAAGLQLVTVDNTPNPGTRIAKFAGASGFAAAGLKPGDRLLSIDGISVLGVDQFDWLRRSIPGGSRVEVAYADAGGNKKTATATLGTLANSWGYRGYHGITLQKNSARPVIGFLEAGSPAAKSEDVLKGATIVAINGRDVSKRDEAAKLLNGLGAGREVTLDVEANGTRREVRFVIRQATNSIWISRSREAGGGWSYLRVIGSTSFMTADLLISLLDARRNMGLRIPEVMMKDAYFALLHALRKNENGTVPDFLYDNGGRDNYVWVKDVRQHFARGNACEMACQLYCESGLPTDGRVRDQGDLAATMQQWLTFRWNLDRVRFPSGHNKKLYSIAPYYLPYSYYTTMEAANHLKGRNDMAIQAHRFGLSLLTSEYVQQKKPGVWFVANLPAEIPLQYYNMLMIAGELKAYFEPRVTSTAPELKTAFDAFQSSRYGEAGRMLLAMSEEERAHAEVEKLEEALTARYRTRVAELKAIHKEYPRDALRYLEQTKPHFEGLPAHAQLESLAEEWKRTMPAMPKWFELGPCPGAQEGEEVYAAWERVLGYKARDPKPSTWAGAIDLLAAADPARDALAGKWQKADGQLISPASANARIQLKAAPKGSYRFETQFTRMSGHCMTVMFPVGDTSGVLVIGGWAGKVSGIANIDGKDADRNATKRDGKITSNVKHNLQLAVNLLDGGQAKVTVYLDGKSYLEWEGKRSSLTPDRAWNLRSPGALGLGGYNASIVFHGCQFQAAE